MKEVTICTVCYSAVSDGRILNQSEIIKMMITIVSNPKAISIKREICLKCQRDIPERHWKEILKPPPR